MIPPDSNQSSFRRYCVTALLTVGVFLGATWLWVIQAPLAYFSQEYAMWRAKIEMVGNGQVGTVAILGDSRPMADIIPSLIGPGIVNLALPGITPIEIYYQSQEILASPNRPKAVIISISPYLFSVPFYFWERSAGYGFLNGAQLNEIRRRARALDDSALFEKQSFGDIDARMKCLLYSIKFPSLSFPSLLNGRFYLRYHANIELLNSVLAERGQAYFGKANGSTAPDFETRLQSFVPAKIIDDYFNRTLSLYRSQHVPVYFLVAPHNEASEHLYCPGLGEAYAEYINRYLAQYPDFRILGDPFPSYPSQYFGDSFHLNKEGATKFSNLIAKLLNDARVEGGPFGPN
jgi:hypothetical protein